MTSLPVSLSFGRLSVDPSALLCSDPSLLLPINTEPDSKGPPAWPWLLGRTYASLARSSLELNGPSMFLEAGSVWML